jgi:hypothetical protein
MHLLADEFVQLDMVESISDETVRRTLKNPWGAITTYTGSELLPVVAYSMIGYYW